MAGFPLRHYKRREVRRMNDEAEESEQRRRDMIQIVWVLMPVAIFFVLLLLIEWVWLYER
jgi:hypothetical protein